MEYGGRILIKAPAGSQDGVPRDVEVLGNQRVRPPVAHPVLQDGHVSLVYSRLSWRGRFLPFLRSARAVASWESLRSTRSASRAMDSRLGMSIECSKFQ